ncbi:MAG: protein phosphatase 2C domain-containing protein [Pseudomonadales bacterium]|nr:protein phosphatase 2C domain-containing protein [Pseudomonadales bacterium]
MSQNVWLYSAGTHCGAVRNMNEDAYMARSADGLWAVADGMGGHDAGEVASNMISSALDKLETQTPIPELVDAVEDTLLEVHRDIRNYSRTHCDGRTMGSTVVVLITRENLGICIWAGDSRLYRYRDDQLTQVSIDHSQVNEMVARGLLTPEEAENHPASNVITRAVGATDTLYLDTDVCELRKGDVYLLCSDGLYGALSHDEILNRLRHSKIHDCANDLIQDSLHNGARDNVTVVVLQVI